MHLHGPGGLVLQSEGVVQEALCHPLPCSKEGHMNERFTIIFMMTKQRYPGMCNGLTKQEVRDWIDGFMRDDKYLTFHIQREENADG